MGFVVRKKNKTLKQKQKKRLNTRLEDTTTSDTSLSLGHTFDCSIDILDD